MNHNVLQPFFDAAGVVILDGALATELETRGADLNDALWSARLLLEDPSLIRQVHADYLTAGADVVTTASYQATFEGFARRGIAHDQAIDLMRLSIKLAVDAREAFWADPARRADRQRPLVAISIGPYGAFLADGSEYRGDYGLSIAALMDFHRPRLAALVEAGVALGADLLACETIPCLDEGIALTRVLAEFPALPAWLSFSCRSGDRVAHGEHFADCTALAETSDQIIAAGINCTPPRYIEDLLHAAAESTHKPLLCYPNSGEAWDPRTHCWVDGTGVVDFAIPAQRWRAAGARLIGGCCRTTPDDIRAIRAALLNPEHQP